MWFFKKLCESEKTEILNLSQQKEEETISCRNQIILLQFVFPENLLAIEMKKKNTHTYTYN